MSSGQRKRVTFADLVTARLPSSPPQQTPGPRSPETDVTSVTETSPVTPETVADIVAPVEFPQGAATTGRAIPAIPAGADLYSAPAINPVTEDSSKYDESGQPPSDRQPLPGSQPLSDRQPSSVRRTFRPADGSQIDSQPPDNSQPRPDSQPLSDRHPLKEVKGYLKLANTVVDSLLPTLDVYEQAVFVQLYRLTHGFGNFTCKVSLPALQARTGVKPTSLKQAIARLQARGVVEKISADIGFGREQGITYWVSADGRQTYGDWQTQGGSQSPGDDNKRKEHSKENKLKGGLTPDQVKSCPDCNGVGMWYPEGPGRGVARCYHPSLKLHREP